MLKPCRIMGHSQWPIKASIGFRFISCMPVAEMLTVNPDHLTVVGKRHFIYQRKLLYTYHPYLSTCLCTPMAMECLKYRNGHNIQLVKLVCRDYLIILYKVKTNTHAQLSNNSTFHVITPCSLMSSKFLLPNVPSDPSSAETKIRATTVRCVMFS